MLAQPIPRDVLARSRRIDHRICHNTSFYMLTLEVYTKPNISPDLGYSQLPFNSFVSLSYGVDIPEFGIAENDRLAIAHTGFAEAGHRIFTVDLQRAVVLGVGVFN